MKFTVKLHPSARKFLKKADTVLSERIHEKLQLVAEDPFRYLEHYSSEDVFKLRIGQYRALIDVDYGKKVLFVQHIDHRKRIYKR